MNTELTQKYETKEPAQGKKVMKGENKVCFVHV